MKKPVERVNLEILLAQQESDIRPFYFFRKRKVTLLIVSDNLLFPSDNIGDRFRIIVTSEEEI